MPPTGDDNQTWFGDLGAGPEGLEPDTTPEAVRTVLLQLGSQASEAPGDTPRRSAPPLRHITPEGAGRYTGGPPGSGRVLPPVIGEGAIGRVLLVFDAHLGREIALKELRGTAQGAAGSAWSEAPAGTGPASPRPTLSRQFTERFIREARVTAQLEHPAIVPVYELGRREDGTLYYTMKRVRGRTLSEAIRAAPDLAGRLRLLDHFVQLCQAIAYAHSRGVVHRDLKPQNVMVGAFGETVVLDWGLAKVRGEQDLRGRDLERGLQQLTDASATLHGSTLGTPAYMSPEQANGHVANVDERSDVWGLGATLREILTGSAPYRGENAHDVLQQVRRGPPPNARVVDRRIPVELAAVAAKAMSMDPAERYPSAHALAEEVTAWRNGEPVVAHPYSRWERLVRLSSKNASMVSLGLVSMVLIALVGVWFSAALRMERDRAKEAEAEALRLESGARMQLARSLGVQAAGASRDHDAGLAMVFGTAALALREDPDARGAVLASAGSLLRDVRWTALSPEPCRALAVRADGVYACNGASRVAMWDASGVERPGSGISVPPGANTGAFAWSPEGERIAVGGTGAVMVSPVSGGEATRLDHAGARVMALAWLGPDTLVTGDDLGALRVWDLPGRRLLRQVAAHAGTIRGLDVSSDGRMVVTASNDHSLRVWDAATGRMLRTLADSDLGGIAVVLSPDDRLVAAAGDVSGGDGRVRIWEVGTGRLVAVVPAHRGEVWGLDWSPDGRWIASTGNDGTVRLIDAEAAEPVARASMVGERGYAVRFGVDGRSVVAAGSKGLVRSWSLEPAQGTPYLGVARRAVDAVAWSPDGAELARLGEDGHVRVVDTHTGALRLDTSDPSWGSGRLAWGADGGILVCVEGAGAWVVERSSGVVRPLGVEGPGAWGPRTSILPGGQGAVGVSAAGELSVWSFGDGTTTRIPWTEGGRPVRAAPLGAGGLVVSDQDGAVWTVPVGWGPPRLLRRDEEETYLLVAGSPDGRVVAAATQNDVDLLDASSGEVLHHLEGHEHFVGALGFSPDGGTLLTAGWDNRLALWDVASGLLRARWEGHQNRVWDAAWSPDGTRVATGSADHTMRIWELAGAGWGDPALTARARELTGLEVDGARAVVVRPGAASR